MYNKYSILVEECHTTAQKISKIASLFGEEIL